MCFMHRVSFEIRSRAALMTQSTVIYYIICAAAATEEYHFEWSTPTALVKYKNALVSKSISRVKFYNVHNIILYY